jgi:hypothetical protein
MIDPELIRTLQSLIGRPCRHDGRPCRILDLLPAQGMLLVETLGAVPEIQLDQYGRASHRAPAVLEVPILAPGGGLSDALRGLLACVEECAGPLGAGPEGPRGSRDSAA